jgi:predicted NAD-dependent protein-ADP-ribosyltransferase YbiA (DUF1768 family)
MKKINITSGSSDPIARILSNLAETPFSFGGYDFKCVEAPLQGIKFEDQKEREHIFTLDGISALKIGRKVTRSIKDGEERFVYWDNKIIPYNSNEHRLLIAAFIREKVRQSVEVQEALISTFGSFIYHDVGRENPKTSLPEKLYIEILLAERQILKRLFSLQ